MQEELECIAIAAVPFIIERDQRQFRQFNSRENIIPFDDLKKEEGYFTAKFDKNKRKLATESSELSSNDDHVVNIIIPAPIIDGTVLTTDLKQNLNMLSHDRDWGFYLADENTALRLSGMLPHIDLAGTDFTVDWRLKELRETEEPWKNISLRDMEMSDNGEEYLCFYNTETHELFEPDETLFEMPENVVVLEIPYEVKLDPVAVAREYGIGETDLLADHHFQMKLTAKVTPLSETGLSKFIAENIERQNNNGQRTKRGR